jgi:hypothetical protein
MIRMIHIAISVDDTHSLTHSLTCSLLLQLRIQSFLMIHSFIHSSVCLSVCLEESKKHHGEWETLSNALPLRTSFSLTPFSWLCLFVGLAEFCG